MPARLVPLLALPLLLAADWPQFLGPTQDGVSPESVVAWKDKLEVLWQAPVGDAHSSPVVADGVVYAFYQPKKENADALAAFDAKTGKPLWEKKYEREKFAPPYGLGPRGTPVVHGGRVFTLGNTGILAAWDAKTGAIVWKVDTLKDFGAKNLYFGVSTSPAIFGGNVVVMVGGPKAGVVAFDPATGKPAWQAGGDPASYASTKLNPADPDELFVLTASNLRSLKADGSERWAVPFKDLLNETSTTPVVFGDTVVVSSVTAGSLALTRPAKGDPAAPKKLWADPKLTCYFSTPVAVGPHLYMVNGAASLLSAPSITLRCVEAATGKVLWSQGKVGKYHAALIRTANDKLLMLDDTGKLSLIQPDPAGFKPLASAQVCGQTWAHPALVDGVVYLRDEKTLLAVKVPAK